MNVLNSWVPRTLTSLKTSKKAPSKMDFLLSKTLKFLTSGTTMNHLTLTSFFKTKKIKIEPTLSRM